jgi:hypothetical protein
MPIEQDAATAYMADCRGHGHPTITVNKDEASKGYDSAYGVTAVRDAAREHLGSAGWMIAAYDGVPGAGYTTGLSSPDPIGLLIFSIVAHVGLFSSGDIGTNELKTIFAGQGEQGVIAVGRRPGSGTRLTFFTKVLGINSLPPPYPSSCPPPAGARSCTALSTPGLLTFVNATGGAIGYALVTRPLAPSFSQAVVISIDGVRPTQDDVRDGDYKFWTIEHLYTSMHPAALTRDFLDFLPRYIDSISASYPYFITCSSQLQITGADCN